MPLLRIPPTVSAKQLFVLGTCILGQLALGILDSLDFVTYVLRILVSLFREALPALALDTLSDPNLNPLPTIPRINYVARSREPLLRLAAQGKFEANVQTPERRPPAPSVTVREEDDVAINGAPTAPFHFEVNGQLRYIHPHQGGCC